MNAASAEPHPDGLAETPPPPEPLAGGSWTRSWWLTLFVLVFAAHILLLLAFGARKQPVPRAVTNVPTLSFADNSSEWLALNDPTLFALPHQKDFASPIWLPIHATISPSFRWAEPPGELLQPGGELGAVFNEFMQTNRFTNMVFQLKPPVKLSAPGLPVESALAQPSALQIQDDLAPRQLPGQMPLPSWPYADVLAPSVVQAVVDADGRVISAVLLSASGYDAADQRALELARAARFAPAPRLTMGRMIFNWQTVPPPPTNPPAASP